MNRLRVWIQEAIVRKLQISLPEQVRIVGLGGSQASKPNIQGQLYVGYIRHRSSVESQKPYVEMSTLSYEIRVLLQAIKGSTGAPDPLELDTDILNLLDAIENTLRGFEPIYPVVRPIFINASDLKEFKNGVWNWSLITQILIRRAPGDEFRKIEMDDWGKDPLDTPLPFPIENLVIRSGLYRDEIGRIGEGSTLDREIDI